MSKVLFEHIKRQVAIESHKKTLNNLGAMLKEFPGVKMRSVDELEEFNDECSCPYCSGDKLKDVEDSIASDGFTEPIVITISVSGTGSGDASITDGLSSLKAAKNIGLDSVPVVLKKINLGGIDMAVPGRNLDGVVI